MCVCVCVCVCVCDFFELTSRVLISKHVTNTSHYIYD